MKQPPAFSPKESDIVRQIRDGLRLAGADLWCRKILGGIGMKDIPDVLGCYKGRFFALEIKRPGWQPRNERDKDRLRRQESELEKISRAGGITGIVHDLQEVIQAFEAADCPLPFQRRLVG